LTHPAGVVGLSDGGAYCGMICDASYPTFLLTHWARGRYGGEKLPLEYVVRKAVSRHGAAVRAIRSRRHRSRKESSALAQVVEGHESSGVVITKDI
jgi:hypothetical protein